MTLEKPKRKPKPKIRSVVRVATMALTATAVVQELRKPAGQRTWHGQVGGLVPYDFRRPTLERVRGALWNPDSERLVTPQVFGVGWTLNVGRLLRLLRGARG